MPHGIFGTILGFTVLLGAGAAVFAAALFIWTVRTLTRPPRRGFGWAVAYNLPSHPGELDPAPEFTEWTFTSGGIELPVWDITGRKPTGPVVLITPGWGQGRVGCLDRVAGLLDSASRIIIWDLPGTGEAPGTCTLGARETPMLNDLVDRVGNDTPIVLMGASMGAGMSIEIGAQRDDICGVIAEAPYCMPLTPARGVLRTANLPWRLNLPPAIAWVGLRSGAGAKWAGFHRAEHASHLSCPLLILHGTDDTVSPIADSRTIADAAESCTLVEIDHGDHHSLWRRPEWLERCAHEAGEFITRCVQHNTAVANAQGDSVSL